MRVNGAQFIDTPMGGSNIGIPAGSFGIRVRISCEATDEEGRQIMAAMSEQLEYGEVNVVCMMNNLKNAGEYFDAAIIFKFPEKSEG